MKRQLLCQAVRDESDSEVADRVVDTQFSGVLSESIVTKECRSVGIPSIGLDGQLLSSLPDGEDELENRL
jgi:small ligand-binding sensory domain FIST